MVPTPYGIRWTSKLICRDLRGLAADCTRKFRTLFSSTAGAPASTSHVQVEVEVEPPIDREGLQDVAFTSSRHSSLITSATDDSDSTVPTDVSEVSLKASGTLYGLLNNKLKELYTSRERSLPLQGRWAFRGAWLVLNLATQFCTSNPSYDIFKGSSSSTSEAALLLEVLQYSVSKPADLPASRVSQMPTMPYTKRNDDSTRHDSVFSTISTQPPLPSSPALLWYTILAGATDRQKTVHAAECLLGHVWPEKDATAFLKVVGDPAERLGEDEDMELRRRLGHVLHPEHNALC